MGKFSASLSWKRGGKAYADLDLHLYLPARLKPDTGGDPDGDVCYKRKQHRHFELDVDMCAAGPESCPHEPVENIVFPSSSLSKRKRRRKRLKPGKYTIVVQNFMYHYKNGQGGDRGPPIPFDVLFSLNGKKTLITGLCTKRNSKGLASAVRVAR